MDAHNVLLKPLITEKSMKDVTNDKFTFLVGLSASKYDVKKAVEKMYGVTVLSITTQITKGQTQRVGAKRTEIKKSPTKKAIVRLEKGQKIDLFDLGA
jgi:large subunit ribosomal protein L23